MTATSTTTPTAPSSRRAARTGAAAAAAGAWPRVTAALHTQGAAVRAVIARQDTPDSTPVVVEALSIPASDPAAVASFLARHKAAAAVHLIPSASTVARCLPVPAGLASDRQQAAAALALVAESEMPSMIPAHRRAAGIIHPGPDTAPDALLVVGWPERPTSPATALQLRDQTWTPELVALAALSRALGGSELALYADRDAGSIALIATPRPHPHGGNGAMNGAAATQRTTARVLRADASSDQAWHASLARAVAETSPSLAASLAAPDSPDARAALLLLNSPMRRPRTIPADPAWLSNYGLAYGALCALAELDPAARPLALLRTTAPREDAGLLVRAVEYFSNRKRAAITIAAFLALLLLWPLAVAKTREVILEQRAGGSQQLDGRLKEAERRVAFYKQLREKRWPMTKLLADIATAAPVGVHLDTISLTREQGVNIRGRAQKTEQVTDFRSNLAASGIFGAVTTPVTETEADAITFQLEAQVTAPQYAPRRKDEQDFVKNPLAVRLYGERARKNGSTSGPAADAASPTAAPTASPSSDTPRASRSSNRGSVRGETPAREEPATGTRRAASGAKAIPDPISDADIKKLDRNAAMKEWTSRKAAAATADLDPAVKQRLLDESEKCKTRMQEAGSGG